MTNVVFRGANGTPQYGTNADGSTNFSSSNPAPAPSGGGGNNAGLTKTPSTSTTTTKTTGTLHPGDPGFVATPVKANPDPAYATAEQDITPTPTPSEGSFFDKLYQQFAPVLQSINDAEHSAETAAYAAGSKEETDLNASLGTRGMGGSSGAASEMATVNRDTAAALATAKQNQSTALSGAFSYLTGQAHTDYTDALASNTALSKEYVANMQSTALATIKGIAESGITSADELQQKDPKAYQAVLQYYNGDATALNSALVMNQPNNKIAQSWVQGSTYYQLVTDPITGKPKIQSVDTGVNIPTSWVANKVSTTTLLMQDPNDPANSVTYTTNPFTGAINASGSGTGSAIADQYNKTQTSSGGGTGDSTGAGNTGPGTASTTVSTILGVDPTASLSDVIANSGIGAIVAAMTHNEGGSPAGVVNNPGNVKFTGASGQTDSGVKATDGGTFASYKTPEEGQNAVADIITSAANGSSSVYGTNPTLQSFVGQYTNTGTPATGTNGLATGEYGLLANVPGFNPAVPGVDQSALNYLKEYLTQGKVPTAASVGISTRTGSGAMFNTVAQRADDVYFKATGQHLPDATILASNKKLIAGNNSILNNLSLQEGTISANADLLVNKVNAANLNQSAPTINKVLDAVKNSLGDVDTASLIAQSSTLQNELGSLLALKNATGTTVHDKLESAGLIDNSYNSDQIASVVNTLMQEAQNSHAAITTANAKLYAQIDPLQLDPQNPLSNPTTFSSSVGIDLPTILKDNPGMTAQEVVQQYLDSN